MLNAELIIFVNFYKKSKVTVKIRFDRKIRISAVRNKYNFKAFQKSKNLNDTTYKGTSAIVQ